MIVVDYLAWWSLGDGDGSPGNPTRPSEKGPSILRSVAFSVPLFWVIRFSCHRRRILAVLTGRTLVLLFFISALSRDAVLPAR